MHNDLKQMLKALIELAFVIMDLSQFLIIGCSQKDNCYNNNYYYYHETKLLTHILQVRLWLVFITTRPKTSFNYIHFNVLLDMFYGNPITAFSVFLSQHYPRDIGRSNNWIGLPMLNLVSQKEQYIRYHPPSFIVLSHISSSSSAHYPQTSHIIANTHTQ